METEVVAALLMSAAAVVTSIVTLISTIASSRQTNLANHKLEVLKHRLIMEANEAKAARGEITKLTNSLRAAIQAIQEFRDTIQIVITAPSDSLDTESACKYIMQGREQIFQTFQQQMAILSPIDVGLLHKAKNIALEVEHFVLEALYNKPYASDMPQRSKEALTILRARLADIQQSLRDNQLDRATDGLTL